MSIKIFKKDIWKFLVVVVLLGLVFACSIDIITIEQPSEIDAGAELTVMVNCKVEPAGTNNGKTLVVGFLVPKSWNAKLNTSIYYTCTALGANNEKMILIPDSEKEPKTQQSWPNALMQDQRYGLMGNVLSDLEWVVFRSAKTYDVNNTVDFQLKVIATVGAENMLVNLGYFIGNAGDGLSEPGSDKYHDGKYAQLSVVNGTGDLIDFVNPQVVSMELPNATDNDVQTIFYDGDLIETTLSDESNIYICAKAYTTTGNVIDRCEKNSTALFKPTEGINKYRFDFWPRSYFGLNEAEALERIEYYLTDVTGTKRIGSGDNASDSIPFKFTFNCK